MNRKHARAHTHTQLNQLCAFVFVDSLCPLTAGTPCGRLVVPHSDHSDGHHNTSTTLDTINVTCDDGYLGGSSTVVCNATNQTASAWSGLPTCTGGCSNLTFFSDCVPSFFLFFFILRARCIVEVCYACCHLTIFVHRQRLHAANCKSSFRTIAPALPRA